MGNCVFAVFEYLLQITTLGIYSNLTLLLLLHIYTNGTFINVVTLIKSFFLTFKGKVEPYIETIEQNIFITVIIISPRPQYLSSKYYKSDISKIQWQLVDLCVDTVAKEKKRMDFMIFYSFNLPGCWRSSCGRSTGTRGSSDSSRSVLASLGRHVAQEPEEVLRGSWNFQNFV